MSAADPVAVLRAVCSDAARRAHGAGLRAELTAIGRQLDRPLQLAVAGAVSVGKSTLINAVLRRPVAPADAGECTRLVTWYEFGPPGQVIVECTDGTVRELGLVHGRVPAALGVRPAQVARLRVRLADPWLRRVTLIDTPGVNTVSAENEEATRRLLFGDAAAEHAQALLYVLRYVQRFDADILTEFRTLSEACGMTAVNTAAVLTQVDRRGDDIDPWPTARRLARKATSDLGAVVLDVVPVVGLLAETARARLLGPAEVAALRELAALDQADLDDLLLDLDEFVHAGNPDAEFPAADGSAADGSADAASADAATADIRPTAAPVVPGTIGPVALPLRRTLVARLHRYGIREAAAHLRRYPQVSVDDLHRWLAGRSGFGSDHPASSPTGTWQVTPDDPDLVCTLAEVVDRFTRHADRLKAFTAAGRLARLSGEPPDRPLVAELRETVDENRPVAAGLRSLRILAACAAVGRGQLRLDEEMTAELMALARRDEPAAQLGLPPTATAAQIGVAAGAASRRWRRVAQLAGASVGGHRARDVLGVLEDIAAAAMRPSTAPPPRASVPPTGRPPVRVSPAAPPRPPVPPRPPAGRDLRPALDRAAGDRAAGDRAAGDRAAGDRAAGDRAAGDPVSLDRAALERLLGSAVLAERERAAVVALRDATGLRAAVGAPPGSSRTELAGAATELAGGFRALLHRPLPPADRRTVQAICDTVESIVHWLRAEPGEETTVGRSSAMDETASESAAMSERASESAAMSERASESAAMSERASESSAQRPREALTERSEGMR